MSDLLHGGSLVATWFVQCIVVLYNVFKHVKYKAEAVMSATSASNKNMNTMSNVQFIQV